MNIAAKITRDPFAIDEPDALAILTAALRLSKSPRRDTRAWLDLLMAVDKAAGSDDLKPTIEDVMNDLGLCFDEYSGKIVDHECSGCGRVNCTCSQGLAATVEARSSYGMGGNARAA